MSGTNNEVLHFGVFSIPHSHPFWVQILASGSCFQIHLACVYQIVTIINIIVIIIINIIVIIIIIIYSHADSLCFHVILCLR